MKLGSSSCPWTICYIHYVSPNLFANDIWVFHPDPNSLIVICPNANFPFGGNICEVSFLNDWINGDGNVTIAHLQPMAIKAIRLHTRDWDKMDAIFQTTFSNEWWILLNQIVALILVKFDIHRKFVLGRPIDNKSALV